jgi:hypothetical protein
MSSLCKRIADEMRLLTRASGSHTMSSITLSSLSSDYIVKVIVLAIVVAP